MAIMKEFLHSFGILANEEIDSFIELLVPKTLKKGEFFIKEYITYKHVAFIKKGAFRSFYYSSQEEDVTYCFTFENAFLTAYSSLITQSPATENIEAITNSELLMISKKNLDLLESKSPNWTKMYRRIAESEYIKLEKRIFLLQRESAESRYSDLVNNQPLYINSIPLNYLASYLGITTRHLSRIRKSYHL